MQLIQTQVIDNVLPQSYADELEQFVLESINFDWYFIPDIAHTKTPEFNTLKEEDKKPGFTHSLLMDNQESRFFNLFKIIPHLAIQKSIDPRYNYYYMKARAFFQLPSIGIQHNNIHIDAVTPHIVCLYYVNDSDGDTSLFDNDRKTVIQSITPKKNRVVLFDGSIPHSSGYPQKSKRCVINFNLIK
jgi:hypothetical protein